MEINGCFGFLVVEDINDWDNFVIEVRGKAVLDGDDLFLVASSLPKRRNTLIFAWGTENV